MLKLSREEKVDDEDCPFVFSEKEIAERSEVVHEVLGKCNSCGSDANTQFAQGHIYCFPCAYDFAN